MIALNTAESGTITIIIDESFKIDFYELRWAAIAGAGERDVKTSSREKMTSKSKAFPFHFPQLRPQRGAVELGNVVG